MDTKEKKKPAMPVKRTTKRSSETKNVTAKKSGATQPRRESSARTRNVTAARATQTKRAATVRRAPVKRKAPAPNPKRPTPDVVYTQPGPFDRNRFLIRLATVIAAVLALVFGISIFFKVDTVTVSGFEKYTENDVVAASGILEGDNLIGLNEAKIASSIISQLPYVDSVRVGIKLPDTVKIEIKEINVVYAVEADDGSWWLMQADGGIVEKTNSADAELHTKVLGVKITGPNVGDKAVAAQPVSDETAPDGGQVPVTVTGTEQLDTAVSIMQYLEKYGILGQMASIDVSNLSSLELWYGDRYHVIMGDTTELGYKVDSLQKALAQMGDYQKGTLDVSFTTWPDDVGYTPFA